MSVRSFWRETKYKRDQHRQQSTRDDEQHSLKARTSLDGQSEPQCRPSRPHQDHTDVSGSPVPRASIGNDHPLLGVLVTAEVRVQVQGADRVLADVHVVARIGHRLEPHVTRVSVIRVLCDVKETGAAVLPLRRPEHFTVVCNTDVCRLFVDRCNRPVRTWMVISTNLNDKWRSLSRVR